MKVVVTHWIHSEVKDFLLRFSHVTAPEIVGEVLSRETIFREAQDADALITCMADLVDSNLINACPKLKIVAATLKGYDNYDIDACTKRGIWLTTVPDIIIPPTAELAITLALSLMRNVRQGDEVVREGRFVGWRPQLYGTSLLRATVGLIGMGALGQAIANLLSPWQLSAKLYVDHQEQKAMSSWERVDLTYLLRNVQLIIVSLPLSSSTHHLLDSKALSLLRTNTYLVNIGRGSVADESAVLEALNSGQLAGYAADVFEFEDWNLPDRPASISEELRRHPHTIFTPHLGSNPDIVRQAMSRSAAEQVCMVLEGSRPDLAVNDLRCFKQSDHVCSDAV